MLRLGTWKMRRALNKVAPVQETVRKLRGAAGPILEQLEQRVLMAAQLTSTPNKVNAPGTSVVQDREIYVTRYVSQSRNAVLSFTDTTPGLPAGHGYVVGQTYEFTLTAQTSSAYSELFVYPTFSDSKVQI